jgi:hypothetical protein
MCKELPEDERFFLRENYTRFSGTHWQHLFGDFIGLLC